VPRRSRALFTAVSAGLALTLLVAACGDTDGPEALAATAGVSHPDDVNGWVEDTTTTTLAPTTTAAPTTTTAPPPPPTTAAPTVRSQSASASATAAPQPAVAPAPAPKPASSCTEAGMLSMINQERARNGLGALQLRGGATQVACAWSKHMVSAGLGHNGNLGGDLAAHGVTGWKAIGENVGQAGSASRVFSLFMGSGGHRANILNGAFTQVGVGVVTSGSKVWVTLDFVGY
jgi:uncharacterized protein YkwD